jgi:drug/metabolite transporter (DMT)-like permease
VFTSFSAVFVRISGTGPLSTGFYRMFFGGLVLFFYTLFRKQRIWKGGKVFLFPFLSGLFFAMDLTFWHQSIPLVGPGLATLLANFQVIFMALIGVLFFHEKIGWRFLLSIILAFAGLFLMFGWNWGQYTDDYQWGVIAGLITAVCYTGYILFLRESQKRDNTLDPASNMVTVCFSTAFFMGMEGLFLGESFLIPDWNSFLALSAYGILAQGIGWVLMSTALPHIPASRAGLIFLIQPSLSILWDVFFFGKELTVIEISGAALTLVGIYLGAARKKQVKKSFKNEEGMPGPE